MFRKVAPFVLALIIATPAFAKDLTITLNDEEQKALLALIDAGVKGTGLQGVPAAARVLGKLQQANQPTPASAPDKPDPSSPPKP